MKGFSETLVSSTIDHLRDLGYINDVSLAKELNREAMAGKFFSHNGARRYLLNRGIPQHVISIVCSSGQRRRPSECTKIYREEAQNDKDIPSGDGEEKTLLSIAQAGLFS